MRKSLFPLLLAGVVMPFAAFAQDNQPAAPDASGSTPPAASDSATPAASDASSGDAGSPGDTNNTMDKASATTADNGTFVTVPPTGAWRASDLEGKDVYGASGQNIGSISDVLVNEDGKVEAVLVGVGGFLGIGQKDVAVSMSALKFGPGKTEGLKTEAEASAEASAAAPMAGTAGAGGTPAAGAVSPNPATGGTGMAGTATGTAPGGAAPASMASADQAEPVVGDDNLPDRIVLNVTREQLENAPAFDEPEDGSGSETPPATGAAPAASGSAAGSAGSATPAQ